MNKVSFEQAGSLMVTFFAEDGVQDGHVVKVSANGTVAPCAQGDSFCGVAGAVRNGAVGVQVDGFVKVAATLPLELGKVGLVADGKGGVMAGEDGVCALVVDVDTVANTAVICL